MRVVSNAFSREKAQTLYIALIGLCGLALFAYLVVFPQQWHDSPSLLVLGLLCIASVLSQFSSVKAGDITIEIDSIVYLATAILFGYTAAVIQILLARTVSSLNFTLRHGAPTSQTLRRFSFNFGMIAFSTVAALTAFNAVASYQETFWVYWLAWLLAGLVYESLNLGIVIILLLIQGDFDFRSKELRWTLIVGVAINGIMAGMFATAISMSGAIGVMIYVLPVFLISLAYRFQFREAAKHRASLEATVALRTGELEEANVELQELLSQKNRFLAVLSHDMKTPLTAIRLYGQMLGRYDAMPLQKRQKVTKTILDSERTLSELVLNVLDIEQMQADSGVELNVATMDMVAALDEALGIVAPQAQKKSISLHKHFQQEQVFLQGDEVKLRRVVQNLLSNAVKYTPDGGRVDVDLQVQESCCKLAVRDTGCGIPEGQLQQIFAPYHRVEANKTMATGTGLGLSIVQLMVNAHEGQIEVESEVGIGSMFAITLPMKSRISGLEEMTLSVDRDDDSYGAKVSLQDNQAFSQHLPPSESQGRDQKHTDGREDAIL